MAKKINTTWKLRTYDVWGNKQDGYEVNDVHTNGTIELSLKIETHNAGTEHEFVSAYPSDYQLGQVFGTRARLDTYGDDLHITVNRASDGYPLGELECVSHSSLSPIREFFGQ